MAYSATTDIDLFYGSGNVTAWADINQDANATTIANRKSEAIAVADDEIDDVFRTSPFSGSLPLATVPVTIRDLSRKLAGLWLYESRGAYDIDSEGKPVHRWAFIRSMCEKTKDEIRTGKIKTSASV